MCGIAGFYANTKKVDSIALSTALRVMAKEMEKRGTDSWGLMDTQTVVHGMGKISKGLRLPKYLSRATAVHTRYATTGKVKQSNSHPFVTHPTNDGPSVIGMHNGIISNHSTLNKLYDRDCRVDSQHIFEHIAGDRPLDDLEGYGTIVYSKNGQWYIGTFNSGELSVYQTRVGILFASTREAIYKALDAANLWKEAKRYELTDNTVYQIKPDGLYEEYKVNIGQTIQKWDDSIFDKYYEPSFTGSHKWTATEGEPCPYCGITLGFGAIDYCDSCAMPLTSPTDTDAPGFSVEVMPDDCSLPCCECGEMVQPGDEYSDVGNGDVLCLDCTDEIEENWNSDPYIGPETRGTVQ